MSAPRTAEEAFAAYVLLRAASPRGWDGPDAGRRPTTPQGGTHQALHLLVSEPDQAGLHPVDDEGSPDELRRIDGKDPGPAERHNLPPVPATVLGQATRQRAERP
jgi:hypothetical protein